MKIGIVNYGMGNIQSVANAVNSVGGETFVIENLSDFELADKIILPGVGAFPEAMIRIREKNFESALNRIFEEKKQAVLGLCLGMQLLFEESSEFGQTAGLGWIKGTVQQIPQTDSNIRIPHMGWQELDLIRESILTRELVPETSDVYFVHSYYCRCADESNVIARVDYGEKLDVIVQRNHVFGCQFHPEKSQKNGLQILKNFLDYQTC